MHIADTEIADRVTIHSFCFIVGARVAEGASIGPFAHLRPETEVGQQAKIGNFVELKKTSLGAGSKANHLAYLGDATIGPNVNVGAGTITCNYDGERKHQTVIEEGAFIGSDSQLVAPVRSAKALTSRPGRPSPKMCRPGRWESLAAVRPTSKAGSNARKNSTRRAGT